MERKYILDTNIFIEAKNISFPFDIVPSFWDHLLDHAKQQHFFLINEILDEVKKGEDNLSQWFISNIDSFSILPPSQKMFNSASQVSMCAYNNQHYLQSAKEQFFRVADYFLVAYALAENCTIVTHEKSCPNSKKRILIPDICQELQIQCVDRNDFFRKIKFVL